jgi:acyl carrier protein
MYGITETTVHVTYRPLSLADLEEWRSPIGGPLGDLQLYILDQNGEPVPIGVSGELYVGGAGLSRGYLNRPDLTAERFLPHPFSKEPGWRVYRTGDVGRYLPNGDIEYQGRSDRQVKIRGFRIELGEIEAVLTEHEEIREALMVARDEEAASRQLIAYLVMEPGKAANIESVHRLAKERLPAHMVPAFFVVLDKFPLTANRKIDHRALPAPPKSRPALAEAFIAARTETEKKLAAMWGDVLGRDEIGIYDNFFDLGGHSLLATQIMSRVSDAFKINLPLRCFFDKPTVAGLAEFIGQAKNQPRETLPAIKRLPRE